MAKVTSKLQITIPKRLAEQFRIRPGDDIEWVAAGDAIRVVPRVEPRRRPTVEERLALFDRATARQRARERSAPMAPRKRDRGWRREELYERGGPR